MNSRCNLKSSSGEINEEVSSWDVLLENIRSRISHHDQQTISPFDENNVNCNADWYNLCHQPDDCCSGNCYMGPTGNWADGNCYMGPTGNWADGVCHPHGYVPPFEENNVNCNADWYNLCHQPDDCCSGNCYMGPTGNWADGVCHPHGYVPPFDDNNVNCNADWYNLCHQPDDCCSGNCYMGPTGNWADGNCYMGPTGNWADGVCHPHGYVPPFDDDNVNCNADWYNLCHQPDDCCSGNCYMGPTGNWADGCNDDWYNRCKKNADCCSGKCFVSPGNVWSEGVCYPQGYVPPTDMPGTPPGEIYKDTRVHTAGCHLLWYNHCKENDDCCSGNCSMGPDNDWEE
ncbi:hypothetical protein Bhyg_08931, partial [Pseudolycoriella hygida]